MLDNYRDLIDELLGTPTELRRLVEPAPPNPTAMRLIAELRDRDAAVLDRLQRLTREREPYLRGMAVRTPEVPASAAELLAGFDAARGELVSLLMNLTLKDWERTAVDETRGETTLADEVERHVEFDETQVARIKAALGA